MTAALLCTLLQRQRATPTHYYIHSTYHPITSHIDHAYQRNYTDL